MRRLRARRAGARHQLHGLPSVQARWRCQDARIATELKSFLADDSFTSTHSWARDFDLPEFVTTVLRELKRAADRSTGSDVRRAVIGYPVVFAGAEGPGVESRQGLALDRLVTAAQRAGFEEVEFLEEPAAAVVDERLERGLVVVVDFGGGTFDVAVVDLAPDQGEVIALQGPRSEASGSQDSCSSRRWHAISGWMERSPDCLPGSG